MTASHRHPAKVQICQSILLSNELYDLVEVTELIPRNWVWIFLFKGYQSIASSDEDASSESVVSPGVLCEDVDAVSSAVACKAWHHDDDRRRSGQYIVVGRPPVEVD